MTGRRIIIERRSAYCYRWLLLNQDDQPQLYSKMFRMMDDCLKSAKEYAALLGVRLEAK